MLYIYICNLEGLFSLKKIKDLKLNIKVWGIVWENVLW